MITEIIETGKTVDEAVASACQKLGYDLENCEFEIIDFPKKGFLGLKNTPAKVRVSLKEEIAKKAEAAARPPEKKPPEQPRREPERPRQAQQQPPPQRQQPKEQPQRQPREQKEPRERPEQAAQRSGKPRSEVNYNETPPSEEVRAKAATASAYLEGVLRQLDLNVRIEQSWEESSVCLAVQGEGLGAIIGRRGETLDALQYLSGLVANRLEGDYLRVTVDCGDYRLKRKETLEALARRVSEQVLKTDVSKTLEPMNPFERRIIHATVSTIEGVSSTSIGEEPNRRVVITSPTAKSGRRGKPSAGRSDQHRSGERPERGRDRGERAARPDRDRGERERRSSDRDRSRDRDRRDSRDAGRGGRDSRDSRERKPAYQPTREPETLPTEAADQPLYGKIDLE